jgi:hypothetical protein
MPTIETRLRQELRNCAVELRQLAYTLPYGVGEHDLLRLSDRMHAAADGPQGGLANDLHAVWVHFQPRPRRAAARQLRAISGS